MYSGNNTDVRIYIRQLLQINGVVPVYFAVLLIIYDLYHQYYIERNLVDTLYRFVTPLDLVKMTSSFVN